MFYAIIPYFAVKTRERENDEAFIEDQKRFATRNELRTHNKSLAEAAHNTLEDESEDVLSDIANIQ